MARSALSKRLALAAVIAVVGGLASASGGPAVPRARGPVAARTSRAPYDPRTVLEDPVMRMYATFALSTLGEARIERALVLSSTESEALAREVQSYRDRYFAMLERHDDLPTFRAHLTALVAESGRALQAILGEGRWRAALALFPAS